jgi:hypothetical protein
MKIKKRLKDYPPNVPRKLFKLLKECDFNRSVTASKLDINGGYLSNLLNKGIEPPDSTPTGRTVRKKMFLKVHKQSVKFNRTIQKEPIPYYLSVWKHLSKEERHKVIKQYIDWRNKNGQ